MGAPSPEEPRTLDHGRYRLTAVLGRGATATVWRATDTVLGVERAVKLLEPRASGTRQLRRRLLTEARTMAQLDHPGVLRIYDIGNEGEQDFVVMDLVEGGTVGDRVQRDGPLPPALAIDLLIQVLSVLHAAHGRGIVHRDVKPQNLLLVDDETVLLCDFGIALLTEDQLRSTRTGIAMGSLAFMAPEQRLDARSVTQAADIYAIGATLYNLVTAANPVDLFTAEPDSPRWQGVPDDLREVIAHAVRLQPAARHLSAKALALELVRVRPFLTGTPSAAATTDALARMGAGAPPDAALDAPTQVEEWSSDVLPVVTPPAPPGAEAVGKDAVGEDAVGEDAVEGDAPAAPAPGARLGAGLAAAALAVLGIGALWLWPRATVEGGAGEGSTVEAPADAGVAAASRVEGGTAVRSDREQPAAEEPAAEEPAAEEPAAEEPAAEAPAAGGSAAEAPATGAPAARGTAAATEGAATAPAPTDTPAASAAAPAPPEAGSPEPSPDPAAVIGSWAGSMHASGARLDLQEAGGALRGTLRTTHPTTGAVQEVSVTGTLDGRRLRLADELREDPTAGRYDATLSADGKVLEGTFRTFSGSRSFRFKLTRVGG